MRCNTVDKTVPYEESTICQFEIEACCSWQPKSTCILMFGFVKVDLLTLWTFFIGVLARSVEIRESKPANGIGNVYIFTQLR